MVALAWVTCLADELVRVHAGVRCLTCLCLACTCVYAYVLVGWRGGRSGEVEAIGCLEDYEKNN